ncbi:MAG: TIR domain-containing protein [Planctomycetota bacterium]|jgi:hypothetical protein
MKPSIFIGSSVEGLNVARAVQGELQHDFDITLWNQHRFVPSHAVLDSLLTTTLKYEFGLFVFSPDDIVSIRDEEKKIARDNVVFECGMFFGSLGKDSSFFLIPRGIENFHLPSDLSGITPLTYEPHSHRGNLQASVSPACNEIRNRLNALLSTQNSMRSLSGKWKQIWYVNSQNYPPKNESSATIWQIGNRVIAYCSDQNTSFRINATLNGNFLTGTWGDEIHSRYYFGALQLFIHPTGTKMVGKWIGFKSNNTVASGK